MTLVKTQHFNTMHAFRCLSEAMKVEDWTLFNEVMAQSIKRGSIQTNDLDFSLSTKEGSSVYEDACHAASTELLEQALELRQKNKNDGYWLIRSWETAMKTDLLPRVVSEILQSSDQSSKTLRKLFSGIRALVKAYDPDILCDEVTLYRSILPPQAAPGVVRLLFTMENSAGMLCEPIEMCQEAKHFSDNRDECHSLGLTRGRINGVAYSENENLSNYDDGGMSFWKCGTIFFSMSSKEMDSFVSTRSDLALWENLMDLASNVRLDSAASVLELTQFLKGPVQPDHPPEHRHSKGRVIHHLCSDANESGISALLAQGSNPNRLLHEGEGPAIECLASLNQRDRDDGELTAVFRCWDALLEAGLDINERTRDTGETLLMRVAAEPKAGIQGLTYLLSHGADPFVKDASGRDIFERVKIPPDTPGEFASYPNTLIGFFDALAARIAVDEVIGAQMSKKTSIPGRTLVKAA